MSGDAASIKQELEDTIAKHELLEEEYVVAKAKLQMERDEMKVWVWQFNHIRHTPSGSLSRQNLDRERNS